jgi:hypothetical protein
MQVRTASGTRADGPETANLLLGAGQIKFGGILDTKHDFLFGQALLGRVPMGFENCVERGRGIIEKAVGCHDFGMSVTSGGNANVGMSAE